MEVFEGHTKAWSLQRHKESHMSKGIILDRGHHHDLGLGVLKGELYVSTLVWWQSQCGYSKEEVGMVTKKKGVWW